MTPTKRAPSMTFEERLWSGAIEDENGCLVWQRSKTRGYGRIKRPGGASGMMPAHRAAYELVKGPIPEGMVLDHLCRNRACINPDHLEPVTNRENILRGEGPTAQLARKTHCPRGHEYDEENTRYSRGTRYCGKCSKAHIDRETVRRRIARQEARRALTMSNYPDDVSADGICFMEGHYSSPHCTRCGYTNYALLGHLSGVARRKKRQALAESRQTVPQQGANHD